MINQTLPYLSDYDPAITSDGSLDPLGLYLIADRLATTMVPGVRERMSQPRYLTAMALGAHICNPFYSEYTDDRVSPAYQVYEWHMVEGFVSKYLNKEPEQISGLPGILKATDAYKNKLPLRHNRYLKTPNVFGFHGVYRTLATELNVITNDYLLGELGYNILEAWQEENKLFGVFVGTGIWEEKVKLFRAAIKDSFKKNEVARDWHWYIQQEFAEQLRPNNIGKKEAKLILSELKSEKQPLRKQIIDFLMSEKGQSIWLNNRLEKSFLSELSKTASDDLKDLISVIKTYEYFARCFQDAFDACLYKMSWKDSVTLEELSELDAVKKACIEMPKIYLEIEKGLAQYNMSFDFIELFGDFNEHMSPKNWIMQMWNHHSRLQRKKGKIGKRNWFERYEDDTFRVHPSNRIKNPVEMSNEFLHSYRVKPLWSFLTNLKAVKIG